VIEHYGLSIADEVPAHVSPLRASSARELEGLLLRLGAAPAPSSNMESAPQTLTATAGTILRSYKWREGGPIWYENLAANVYIDSYGSFTWISSISAVRFYISGFTLGLDLEDVWTDAEVDAHNGQRAYISGGGTIEAYIVIPDAIVFYTFAVDMYRTVDIAQ